MAKPKHKAPSFNQLVAQRRASAVEVALKKPTMGELRAELRKLTQMDSEKRAGTNLRTLSDLIVQCGAVADVETLRKSVDEHLRSLPMPRACKVTELHGYITGAHNPSANIKPEILQAMMAVATRALAGQIRIIPESALATATQQPASLTV